MREHALKHAFFDSSSLRLIGSLSMRSFCYFLLFVLLGAVPGVAQPHHDVLIENGRLLDGSGNPWYRADVAVEGGRIVVVFDLNGLRDTAEFQDPHQLAEGMVHVLVNGHFAIRDGAFTGEKAGRVLSRMHD